MHLRLGFRSRLCMGSSHGWYYCGSLRILAVVNRWDELCTAHSATTIDENGVPWQYAVPRRVVQRSSALLVLESPWMSLTRDALWHNGL